MHNEFSAIIEKDGEWFIACCPECIISLFVCFLLDIFDLASHHVANVFFVKTN
jgi:hypothetical protein